MFEVTISDINSIISDYGIPYKALNYSELERYHYEKRDPDTKQVRLIVKAELENSEAVVIRFKNENDVTPELLESQSRFAFLLKENGIETPTLYAFNGSFAKWYSIGGYDVIVCVEQFVDGELDCVDTQTAFETGALLAKTHNIAESANFHVDNKVLFDPFEYNDLFSYIDFAAHEKELTEIDSALYRSITEKYNEHMKFLNPLKNEPRYAVQGDISNCNLYLTDDGTLGIFDFNRCGDNNLLCDCIMQAVFEARLMDYPEEYGDDCEGQILSAFLNGYHQQRPISQEQLSLFPRLYTIINAFWSADVKWNEDSLINSLEKSDIEAVREHMKSIYTKLNTPNAFAVRLER